MTDATMRSGTQEKRRNRPGRKEVRGAPVWQLETLLRRSSRALSLNRCHCHVIGGLIASKTKKRSTIARGDFGGRRTLSLLCGTAATSGDAHDESRILDRTPRGIQELANASRRDLAPRRAGTTAGTITLLSRKIAGARISIQSR